MTSIKLKFFFLGIVVTSVTWIVLIFLYFKISDHEVHQPKWKLLPRHDANGFYGKDLFNIHKQDMLKNNYVRHQDFLPRELNLLDSDIKLQHFRIPRPGARSRHNGTNYLSLGIIKSPQDQRIKDEGYKKHAFNLLISVRMGYHRTVPYTAHALCRREVYSKSSLPKASVIICFYNEAWSVLIRMIFSILERTPRNLLHEIILVDDFSSDDAFIVKMEQFFRNQSYPKEVQTKFFRIPKRAGLVRARVFGAHKATGEVLVFLDSHCEVNERWLEPLLEVISKNRTTVVCPIIDIINADTFEYTSSPMVRGGFNWGLHFKWDTIPPSHFKLKKDFVKPILSPTMAGGLFAIEKSYFHEIGEYDEGMDIWGGENLELSFRVWMCGGSLMIVPCSRVGHIFRRRRPYGSPDGKDTLTYNSLRVAHVWLDDYKKFYFKLRPDSVNKPYGDISQRIDLRNRLDCHSFEWYLKNIYPELVTPNVSDSSKLSNSAFFNKNPVAPKLPPEILSKFQLQLADTELCVQCEDEVTTKGSLLILQKCSRTKKQMWFETKKREFRLAQLLCMDAGQQYPRITKCHEMGSSQDWRFSQTEKSPVYNAAAGLCLGSKSEYEKQYLIMAICSSAEARKWNMLMSL